jgi:hypothetical protein
VENRRKKLNNQFYDENPFNFDIGLLLGAITVTSIVALIISLVALSR